MSVLIIIIGFLLYVAGRIKLPDESATLAEIYSIEDENAAEQRRKINRRTELRITLNAIAGLIVLGGVVLLIA